MYTNVFVVVCKAFFFGSHSIKYISKQQEQQQTQMNFKKNTYLKESLYVCMYVYMLHDYSFFFISSGSAVCVSCFYISFVTEKLRSISIWFPVALQLFLFILNKISMHVYTYESIV